MTKRRGFGGMPEHSQADFALKQRLCVENMSVIDIVEPGLSAARGRLLFELFSSVFELAQTGFLSGTMEHEEFYRSVGECQKLLTEGSKCLRDETNANGKYEKWIKHSKTSLDGLTDNTVQ